MKKVIIIAGLMQLSALATADIQNAYTYKNGEAIDSVTGLSANTLGVQSVNDRFGNANSAFEFFGLSTDRSVDSPNMISSQIDVSGDMTVSVWAAMTSGYQVSALFSFQNPITNGVTTSSSNLLFVCGALWNSFDGCNNPFGALTALEAAINVSAFNLYTVSLNSLDDTVSLYLNGSLFGVANYAAPMSGTFTVGSVNQFDAAYDFTGVIDDVFVFNSALNAGEVSELYDVTQTQSQITGLSFISESNIGSASSSDVPSPIGLAFIGASLMLLSRKR